MPPLLISQSRFATAARVTGASSERGLSVARVSGATANAGSLHLASHGIPTAEQSLDVRLQRGGIATGPADPAAVTPGVSAIYQVTGAASDAWLGWIDTPILHWAATVAEASGTSDVPAIGQIRQLANNALGFVAQSRGAVTTSIVFSYKSLRTDTFTNVTIESNATIVDQVAPALVVFPSGRLVCYYSKTIAGQSRIIGKTSTDNGLTWASYTTVGSGAASGTALHAEVVGDYVMLVKSVATDANKGTTTVSWSADGGITFGASNTCTYLDSGGNESTACSYATTAPGLDGTYAVVALAQIDATNSAFVTYQLAPGGGFDDATTVDLSGSLGAPAVGGEVVLGLASRDDGSIYLWCGSSTAYPARTIYGYVSRDGGLSWARVGGTASAGRTVWQSGDTTLTTGPKALSMGFWQGYMVALFGNTATSSSDNDGLIETWWGGFDTHTVNNEGQALFDELTALPFDVPPSSWTRTDTGGGGTVSLGSNGIRIVQTATEGSVFTLEAAAGFTPAPQESRFLTFVGRVSSDGSITDNRAILEISIDDNTNRQRLRFRFASTGLRAADNSGTLATITKDLTTGFELRIFFKHDEPSATAGLASARIRIPGETLWTTVLDNQSIAEEAGVTGDHIKIGGIDAGAVDWSIAMLRVSEDGDNEAQTAGFTNPTDLAGRGLGSLPTYLRGGVSVSAYNGVGVSGDTYTVATTYQYPRSAVWRSKRPADRWRSESDNTAHTLTFDGDGSLFAVDWIGLVNTNFPVAEMKFNTSSSFVTPAYTAALSAVVYSGVASSVGAGFLEVDGEPWRRGQFRSRTFGAGMGRRWFLALSGITWEITDNSKNRIEIEGVDMSSFTGASFRIFADRMSVRLPTVQRYEFMQLSVTSAQTADNCYQCGLVWCGEALELVPYALGYSDESEGRIAIVDAESGSEILSRVGPMRRRKRVAWDATDNRASGWFLSSLEDYLGAIDINAEPVVLVEDTAAPNAATDFMLARIDGPLTYENVVGSEHNQMARIAQLPFAEVV